MVFDVPAESGGALTILNEFYNDVSSNNEVSSESVERNEWIFAIGRASLHDAPNILVLKFPWVKNSWFHRLFFDYFVAKRLVSKYDVDEIISLQNVIIPRVNVTQTLYVHQVLPFSSKKYGIFENTRLWIYQNVISRMILQSIKKAHKVIVQTEWLKYECIRICSVNPEKIVVKSPRISGKILKSYAMQKKSKITFFYPANGFPYKNHKIIIEATKALLEKGINDFCVVFTLTGNESKEINRLYNITNILHMPIQFIGSIDRDRVYEYYGSSILIFPSYIESYGLPLLEAKAHGTPILASDCPFSHEILDGYEGVVYFDPFSPEELTTIMSQYIE